MSTAEEIETEKQNAASANQELTISLASASEAVLAAEAEFSAAFADYKGPDAGDEQHSALEKALTSMDWSCFGKGLYDLQYLHEKLQTELTPEELIADGIPPQYEELKKVVAALDKMTAENRSNTGNFHEIFNKVKAELMDWEAKFQGTQVNIDDMEHQPFHDGLDTFQKCINVSVEHICKEIDLKVGEKTEEYNSALDKQLGQYRTEQELVEKTSFARLRATRPEDEMDPWEVPKEKTKLSFENPALQAIIEKEEQDKVAEEFEDEWYASRRKDVDSVLPRAQRIVREFDEEEFFKCADILDKIVELCQQKSAIVNAQSSSTGEQRSEMLAHLKEQIQKVKAAGEAFQETRAKQKQRSERDIEKVKEFVAVEHIKDKEAQERFAKDQQEDLASFNDFGVAMDDLRMEILEKQKKLGEYAEARKQLAASAAKRLEEEQKRKSCYENVIKASEEYNGLLQRSLNNFLLPQGYNSGLTECLEECHVIAAQVFERQHSILATFMNQSVVDYANYSSTLYHHLYQLIHRKTEKFRDLDKKAVISKMQRDFCLSTGDPLAAVHATREQEVLAMSSGIKTQVAELEQRTAKALEQFQAVLPTCEKLDIKLPYVSIVDLPTLAANTAATFHRYITKAPRPPLTNLHFADQERLSLPAVWYEDDRQLRALQAHGQKSAPANAQPAAQPAPAAKEGENGTGTAVKRGMALHSSNSKFHLVHQDDGNVVLYHGEVPKWATNSNGKDTTELVLQGDGNLVLYTAAEGAVWATNTSNGTKMALQDDGNFVLYDQEGKAVWATNTPVAAE